MGLLDWITEGLSNLFTSDEELERRRRQKQNEEERIRRIHQLRWEQEIQRRQEELVRRQHEQFKREQELIRIRQQEQDANRLQAERLQRLLDIRNRIENDVLARYRPPVGSSIINFFRRNGEYGSLGNGFIGNCSPADKSIVRGKFNRTTQRHFKILDMKKIDNPYTYALYALRRKEYKIMNSCNPKEEVMFHGTKLVYIDNIKKFNFDWRLHGKSKGNIFGQGASFSPISNYASNYCDKTESRYMIAVMVLKFHSCIGNRNMIVPSELHGTGIHYDTSEKENGSVCVKYRDDEFYPYVLIEFSGYTIKKI